MATYVPTYRPQVREAHWAKIAPFLPEPKASPKGGPKPIANRHCFEGIVWVLQSGARWKDLPKGYPSPSTCWRRLEQWMDDDVWLKAWRAFLGELDEQGRLAWEEVFADGTFVPAKKGALRSGPPNAARVQSFWWWQAARVFLSEFNWPRRPRTKRR